MSKKGFHTGTSKTMPGLQDQSRRQSSFSSAVLGKRNTVVDQLKMEMDAYETIIKNAEKRLEDAPEGFVRAVRHGNSFQYYRRGSGETNGSYIHASDIELARSLVQKRYDQQVLDISQKQKASIEKFLAVYDPDSLKRVYTNSAEGRRRLISPEVIPDEEYKCRWKDQVYQKKDIAEGTPEHYTLKNEKVRSKSEVMIANELAREELPYRYECPLALGGRTIFPDFTILRLRDRQEIFWEHLGLMDDSEYRHNAFVRIREYEKHGIHPGQRLIITFETYKIPLNLEIIKNKIRTYLL